MIQPFLVDVNHGGKDSRVTSVEDPLRTITAKRGVGLAQPFVMQIDQTGSNGACVRSTEEPLFTAITKQNMALVEPFLTKYYSTGGSKGVDEPLDTVTAKARFALVEPLKGRRMDIRFRMLQPAELAAAMGFENYRFTGNKTEQTKQIGNAVPVHMAAALCEVILRRQLGL